MNVLQLYRRPEYLLRPAQIWRRIRCQSILARNQVRLAWGLPIEVDPSSHVGHDILCIGMCDRIVPETILRLLDPGETAIDVGANIGQNLSMMALAAGPTGRTIGFEPGPRSLRLLDKNVAHWARYELAPISVVRKGASNRAGAARLHHTPDLGGFSLEDQPIHPFGGPKEEWPGDEIEVTTLDSCVDANASVGLMKIDVEGHESLVLEGARRLLEERQIRDIIYEDFKPHPSPATLRLQTAGYAVFSLVTAWGKPLLFDCRTSPLRTDEPPNFLATMDPERALERMRKSGWMCFHARARLVLQEVTHPH